MCIFGQANTMQWVPPAPVHTRRLPEWKQWLLLLDCSHGITLYYIVYFIRDNCLHILVHFYKSLECFIQIFLFHSRQLVSELAESSIWSRDIAAKDWWLDIRCENVVSAAWNENGYIIFGAYLLTTTASCQREKEARPRRMPPPAVM